MPELNQPRWQQTIFLKFCNITDLVTAAHQTLLCRLRPWHLQTTASAGQVWWFQWGTSWSAAFPTSAARTGIRLWLVPASVTWSSVQPKLWLGSINSRCLPGLCETEGLFFCPLLVAQPGSTQLLPLFSKVNWIFVLLLLLNDHQSIFIHYPDVKERPLTLRLSCWNHLTCGGVWLSTALKQTLLIFSFSFARWMFGVLPSISDCFTSILNGTIWKWKAAAVLRWAQAAVRLFQLRTRTCWREVRQRY